MPPPSLEFQHLKYLLPGTKPSQGLATVSWRWQHHSLVAEQAPSPGQPQAPAMWPEQ